MLTVSEAGVTNSPLNSGNFTVRHRFQGERSRSNMGRIEGQRELARKRKRREQLKKFRAKFAKAKTQGDREAIIEKVFRISPFAVLEASVK